MLLDSGCVICEDKRGPVCAACSQALIPADGPSIDGLDACRVAYRLDDASKTMVAALKYKHQRRLARWLGSHLEHMVPRGADVITWLPATPERRASRGYDHAEELARALARRSGVPARKLLVRDPTDQRQTGLSRAERQQGPTLQPVDRVSGLAVLVDDVITTGSSMRVGAARLRQAGAERIVGLAVAATPMPESTFSSQTPNRCSVNEWM